VTYKSDPDCDGLTTHVLKGNSNSGPPSATTCIPVTAAAPPGAKSVRTKPV
jgi:hypothetical protein